MKVDSKARATAIVADLSSDSQDSTTPANELATLVYDELRLLARSFLRRESPGHSLQPTDLVNETYLRLVDQKRVNWRGKSHFLAIGARMMRRILIDHARKKRRSKRGGDWQRVTLTDAPERRDLDLVELLALNQALEKPVDGRRALGTHCRDALLRRLDDQGDRHRARHLHQHCRPRLGSRSRLAAGAGFGAVAHEPRPLRSCQGALSGDLRAEPGAQVRAAATGMSARRRAAARG